MTNQYNVNLPSFDDIHKLSTQNPYELEIMRKEIIDEIIRNSEHAEELKELQTTIDVAFCENNEPIDRCFILFGLISKSSQEMIEKTNEIRKINNKVIYQLEK